MKVTQPQIEVTFHTPEGFDSFETFIESCGRTCYKSEDKITDESAPKFVKMLRERGHHAMLEFGYATAKIVADRGMSHELVRHRLCSFAQESTRFCCYGKGKFGAEITVVEQPWPKKAGAGVREQFVMREIWVDAMKASEQSYMALLEAGVPTQIARSVLPIGLKTEINIGCNLREWRHIFELRCAKAAHPIIRGVMLEALRVFHARIPALYEDLAEQFLKED